MRVRRSAFVAGVGAGRRIVEVKVSYAPREYEVVQAVAARQGWSAGGWVGAITEYVERLAEPPEGGGLEAAAWGRIAERAGSIEALGGCLTGNGARPGRSHELERAAQRVGRLCSAQAVAIREGQTRANARAAEYAELLVVQLGESFRSAGGADRRRVRVLLSEPTAAVLRRGAPPHLGMAVSEWVGALAAAAAAWLACRSDSMPGLEQWFQRLTAVRRMLLTAAEHASGQEAVTDWASAELAAAERALQELAGASRGSWQSVPTEAVLDRLGWQPGQLRLGLSYPAATMGVR